MSERRHPRVMNPGEVEGRTGLGSPSAEATAQGRHWVRFITREDASVDYYDGEDIG